MSGQPGTVGIARGGRVPKHFLRGVEKLASIFTVSAYLAAVGGMLLATARIRVSPRKLARVVGHRMVAPFRQPVNAKAAPRQPTMTDEPSGGPASPARPRITRIRQRDERARLLSLLACPTCKGSLTRQAETFCCASGGHQFAIVRGIPRFVDSDAYVDSFSFEWNAHKTTQLDTFRKDDSSEEIFREKTGFGPDDLHGKVVLDAGIGAGRFTDIMARWGASVIGIDLSFAVEAAHENFLHLENVLIAQADIAQLPFRPETFDVIVAIGVLHHTPDPRKYFHALVPYLRHGGTMAIWVYPAEGDFVTRKQWIPFTSRIPDRMFHEWCRWFVPLAHRRPNNLLIECINRVFPFSRQGLGLENDILDTFDGYSPRFHGIHTPSEVESWFREAGLVAIHNPGPWNTSMRGIRP
jgi:SAM-dependent methyltransferase